MKNFATVLTNLRAAIAVVAARDRALTALLVLVWGRLSRMAVRLERLMARWQAGTLPGPRKARAARGHTPRERARFPNAPAWLIAHVLEARQFAAQVRYRLADPELAAFVAAVPQAGRILRPLLHMLGIDDVPVVPRVVPRPVWVVLGPTPAVLVADGQVGVTPKFLLA